MNLNEMKTELLNQRYWLDLAHHYFDLMMNFTGKDDRKANEYMEKSQKCTDNANKGVAFDKYSDYEGLIPDTWNPKDYSDLFSDTGKDIGNTDIDIGNTDIDIDIGNMYNPQNTGYTINPAMPSYIPSYQSPSYQPPSYQPPTWQTPRPYNPMPVSTPGRSSANGRRNDRETQNPDANPYNFDLTKTSEEEKLSEYIKAGLPVLIHGQSGCGKSARIKEMDPDCTIIYLSTAKPDTLAGKQINVNGELKDIPPTWYVKLCEKCEKEPDKLHILFLDECTNATPTIQGYAFNLVLDKELDGKWKLPENVRVVAAGNEVSESLSANKMSEPLFRRFNHIYIETTVKSWLLWASKHNIHPAIYAFVASRGDKEHQVLRTECDGMNPCVDPRKWEMASNFLKKSGKANMLSGIIGPALTNEFIEFCKKNVITLDDVLNDRYDQNMPRMKADVALSTLIGLVSVDEQNVKKVRDFVKKYMIAEQYQNFVRMWTLGDVKRIELLREFDLLDEPEIKDDGPIDVTYRERGLK